MILLSQKDVLDVRAVISFGNNTGSWSIRLDNVKTGTGVVFASSHVDFAEDLKSTASPLCLYGPMVSWAREMEWYHKRAIVYSKCEGTEKGTDRRPFSTYPHTMDEIQVVYEHGMWNSLPMMMGVLPFPLTKSDELNSSYKVQQAWDIMSQPRSCQNFYPQQFL